MFGYNFILFIMSLIEKYRISAYSQLFVISLTTYDRFNHVQDNHVHLEVFRPVILIT